MIRLIGKIKEIGSVRILNIYSKNIAEKISESGNKVLIKNYKKGILIRPKGGVHTTVAQKKRIQISITNLIKKEVINTKNIKNKMIYVYIDPKSWNLEEVVRKSIHLLPISKKTPKDLMIKRAAIRLNKSKYYLEISSKKLYEVLKKEKIKCLFNRDKEGLLVIRSVSPEARKLTPHGKRNTQIAIPKKMLSKEEITNLEKKNWLPIFIKLNLNSFGLNVHDFYSVKEENEIVKYLLNKGIKIEIKNCSNPFDIKLLNKDIAIEIHNSIPDRADFSSRHKIKIGQVRLRMLEADYFIKNKLLKKFFLIVNKLWKNNYYINELKLCDNICLLFTDFKGDWYKVIGNKIINDIKKH